jgi:hypothetical protein
MFGRKKLFLTLEKLLRTILLLTLGVFKGRKCISNIQPVYGRPRPVNAVGKELDGTGRHAVDGTRPTRKDGDSGQP